MSVVPLSELGLCGALTFAQTEAAALAAIVAASLSNGAIGELFNPPNTGPYPTGPLVGAASYVLLPPVGGVYAMLYGIAVTADIGCTVSIIMSGGGTLGRPHEIGKATPFIVAPNGRNTYQANIDEGLRIACSDPAATLNVTFWGEYK